jgi:flagellar hook-length control protein FliK
LTDEVNSNGVKPKSAQDPFVKEKPKSGDADDDEEEAGTDMKEDDIPLAAQAAAGAAAESGASGPTGDTAKANDNGGFELPDGMEKTNEPLSKQDMNMANRPELQQSQAQKGKFQAERPKMDAAGQRTEENTADTEGPRAEDNVTRAAQPGDNSNQSRGENGGDGSNNNTGARTESRARADVQRRPGEARASDDERIPTERTNTANVRTDFQSFFEGVLSSRRTGTTPAPMSLSYGTAALPERSEMLSNGVTNVVRFVRADGLQRANIVIEPPSLGRVTVELTSSTSGVEASIRVSNEQVRQLVQDQISQLRMNLEQQGVQVTQFAVDVQQDNGGQGQNSEQDGQRRHGRRVGAIEEAEETPVEEFRVDLEQGLLHWVA